MTTRIYSRLKIIGPVRQGEQQLEVKILSGRFKNQVHSSSNNMMGKMELDKAFVEGDIHYRTGKTIFLCVVFIGVTVLIMGWMGIKILITFVFSTAANMVWVSSEVVHTLVGCFGLMLVAPLTVFAGRMLLAKVPDTRIV
jgi:uncharacterized membrane protein